MAAIIARGWFFDCNPKPAKITSASRDKKNPNYETAMRHNRRRHAQMLFLGLPTFATFVVFDLRSV